MKGTHPPKRVNPLPMITTITEIFNPVLTKPTLKKRDTNHLSHCIGQDLSD